MLFRSRLLGTADSVPAGHGSASGQVTAVHYQGAVTKLVINAAGTRLAAVLPAGAAAAHEGDTVQLVWSLADAVAMESA